jgi:hypothetical protein
MANDYGYEDTFNPNNSFWDTSPQQTQSFQPTQDYSLGGGNPNYFSNSPSNATYESSYQPDYNMFGGNPNYFSSSPSNAVTLGQMYNSPTPTTSGFGGTGLDPSVGVAGYTPEEEQPWWKKGLPQVSQGQADLFKGLAGLYSAYAGNKQAGQLRQAAQQQDPFGPQRAQYQQLLSQSYSNPTAFTSTPEARMQQDALKQQLERLDAKSGRRSQYGARAVQLAQAQAKQLADYRSGLQQAAGSNIGPQGAGSLQQAAAQAQMTAGGAPFQALSDIFTGQSPQYRAQAAENQKLRDSIALLSK